MILPPNVDGRRVERFVRALRTYAAQYTPDLDLSDGTGAGAALFRIFAQLAETVAVRLDRAPQKHFVAFLDTLGIVLVPARTARVPVTFKLANGLTTPVKVPVDTRVTAPGPNDEIPFETINELVAIHGALSAMYAVAPAEDAIFRPPPDFLGQQPRVSSTLIFRVLSFANAGADRLQFDHVTDLKPGSYLRIDCREKHVVRKVDQGNIVTLERPLESDVETGSPAVPILDFEVFNGINTQEHVLYIGHSHVLNVKAEAVIRLDIVLARPSATPLDLIWEFWTKDETVVPHEEEHWHPLPVQADGTNGLTKSGSIRLVKPVPPGENAELEVKTRLVNERESRWIRARVPGQLRGVRDGLPTIASILIGVESPLLTAPGPDEERLPILADQGFYNATPLDVQVDENIGFFPFGSEPRQFDQFYIASKEAFSKRGAEVTLQFHLDIQKLASPSAVLHAGGTVAAYSIGQRRRLYELKNGQFEILGDPSQRPITGGSKPSRYLPVDKSAPAAVVNDAGTKTFVFVNTADTLDPEPPNRLWVFTRNTKDWVDLDAPPAPPSGKKQIQYDPGAVTLSDGSGFARVFVVSAGKLYSQLVPEAPVAPAAWAEHGQPPDGAALTSAPWVVREPTTNTLLVYVTGTVGNQYGVYQFRFGAGNPWTRLNDAMAFEPLSRPFAQPFVKNGELAAKVFIVARDAPNAAPKLFERDTRKTLWVDLGHPTDAVLEGNPVGFVETLDEELTEEEGKHIFVMAKQGEKEKLYERLDGTGAGRWHDTTEPGDPDLRGSPSLVAAAGEDESTHVDVVVGSERNSLLTRKYRIRHGTVMADAEGRAALLSLATPAGDHEDKKLTVFEDDDDDKIATTTIQAYDESLKLARIDPPVLPPIHDGLDCEIDGDERRRARDDSKSVLPVHDPIGDPKDIRVVDFRVDGAPVRTQLYSPLTGLLKIDDGDLPAEGTPFSLQTVLAQKVSESRPSEETDVVPELSWEYWNGRGWLSIPDVGDGTRSLLADGSVFFPSMPAVEPTEVAGQDNFWIRVRLVGGDYGREIFKIEKDGTDIVRSDKTSLHPPKVATLRIVYIANPIPLETCLTFNNLNYLDQTAAAQLSGASFPPFEPLAEPMRAVFLGFERPFKSGPVRVLLDAAEREVDPRRPPAFRWEFRKDHEWRDLAADDESQALTRQGLLTLSAADELTGDTLFGRTLYWIRGMLRDDRDGSHLDYPNPLLRGVFPNTVWTSQGETITDEIVASSDGAPGQRHPLQHANVLREQQRDDVRGEEIRVLEALSVEERDELVRRAGSDSIVDREDIGGPWVRWNEVRAFFDAGPTDRCYSVDRAAGILRFGDGVHGAIPPAGIDNIRAFRYRTGGGAFGNVAPGSINTLATAVQGVESVFNPTAAGGGSDTATTDTMLRVGPQQISHRDRAVSPEDFEELAVEATRQVARARCLAATNLRRVTSQVDPCHPAQRHDAHDARGWVSVIIVPRSPDPLPCPSLELRRTVRDYLRERAPTLLVAGDRLVVRPPDYVVVSVAADLYVESLEHASIVEDAADKALRKLLHPLEGGPEDLGWEFGRPIAASDVFAVLETIRHVDHVEALRFKVAGRPDNPAGVEIGPHQLLASGTHALSIKRNGA